MNILSLRCQETTGLLVQTANCDEAGLWPSDFMLLLQEDRVEPTDCLAMLPLTEQESPAKTHPALLPSWGEAGAAEGAKEKG